MNANAIEADAEEDKPAENSEADREAETGSLNDESIKSNSADDTDNFIQGDDSRFIKRVPKSSPLKVFPVSRKSNESTISAFSIITDVTCSPDSSLSVSNVGIFLVI